MRDLFWGVAYLMFASFLLVFSGSAIYAYVRHLRHIEGAGLLSAIEDPENAKDKVIVQGLIRFWGPFVFTLFVGLLMLIPPLAGAQLSQSEDFIAEACMPLFLLVMAGVLWFWFLTEFGETYILSEREIVRMSTFMKDRAIEWKDIKDVSYDYKGGVFRISDGTNEFSIENRMKNIWVLPELVFSMVPEKAVHPRAELHLRRLARRRHWNL